MLRVGLVVGEPSGDELGAGLVKALQHLHGDIHVEGILGPRLIALGGDAVFPMEQLSVMGLVEVLAHYVALASIRNRIKHHFFHNPPDIFIGIDAPDFNLQLEKELRSSGIKTIHYVSPSVWAWRPGRVATVAVAADKLLTLFPFEADFYKQQMLDVECVGHPLADAIPLQQEPHSRRTELRLPLDRRLIAIMPGSRQSEFDRHAKAFITTALACWEENPKLHFASSFINDDMKAAFLQALELYAPGLPIQLYTGRSREVLEACDVALLASGTITLEAMLLKKPMVIAYRMSAFSYYLLRLLVSSNWVGLPNILAQETLVPEYLQNQVQPRLLAPALLHWLNDNQATNKLKQRFHKMHSEMKLDTNDKAAKAVLALCRK